MSLSSLVDKPLIQNPLAGGGAMIRPQESQLQGDPLVEQMQMRMTQRDKKTPGFLAYFKDVMDTKGYPTKTMQEYESQFPGTTPQQVPLGVNISNANFNTSPPGTLKLDPQADMPKILGDPLRPRSDDPLMQGFFDSEFYSPRSTTNVVNYKFRGKDMQGSGSQASDLQKYLESIGQGNLIELSNESIAQQGSGPLATMPTQEEGIPGLSGSNVPLGGIQTPPSAMPTVPMVEGAVQTPLSGDQGLMDRLTSLEQGIGSLQNQIASLFQTQQASDPFGLGGFINTRRY